MTTIRIIHRVDGRPSELDGSYVVEYNPLISGRDADGVPWVHLITTRRRKDAKQFPDARAAVKYYFQEKGIRPDGEPDRPLTMYTVAVEPNEESHGTN